MCKGIGSLKSHTMGLAEHDIYGSSRLGVKDYWVSQVGLNWDYADSTYDTVRLWQRKPWYSLEYQDVIKDTARSIYGNTLTAKYLGMHITGLKQYEFTDHLGDVLATISDARMPNDTTTLHATTFYNPIIQSAYDYYPFGMLMPGRYTCDSTIHCADFTEMRVVPVTTMTWVPWSWGESPNPYIHYGQGTLTQVQNNGGVLYAAASAQDVMADSLGTQPAGVPFEVDLDVTSVGGDTTRRNQNASFTAMLVENDTLVLATAVMPASPQETTYKLAATPSFAGSFSVYYCCATSTPGWVVTHGSWVSTTTYVTENVVTSVCSEDHYHYGFNGKLKDNEWAGVGNHLDFGARAYDPRVARWLSIDPMAASYQSKSPFIFGLDNPMFFIDHGGKNCVGFLGKDGKLYIHATYYAVSEGVHSVRSDEMSNMESRINDFYKGAVNMTVTLADGKKVQVGGIHFEVKPGGNYTQASSKVIDPTHQGTIEKGANLMLSLTPSEIQKEAKSSTTAAISTKTNSTTVNTTKINAEQAGQFLTGSADKEFNNEVVDEAGHVLGTTHPGDREKGESKSNYNQKLENYGSMERGQKDGSGELILNEKDVQNMINSPEFQIVDDPSGSNTTPANPPTQGAPTQTPPTSTPPK